MSFLSHQSYFSAPWKSIMFCGQQENRSQFVKKLQKCLLWQEKDINLIKSATCYCKMFEPITIFPKSFVDSNHSNVKLSSRNCFDNVCQNKAHIGICFQRYCCMWRDCFQVSISFSVSFDIFLALSVTSSYFCSLFCLKWKACLSLSSQSSCCGLWACKSMNPCTMFQPALKQTTVIFNPHEKECSMERYNKICCLVLELLVCPFLIKIKLLK